METTYEVELRYRLDEGRVQVDAIRDKLSAAGFTKQETMNQEDVYYSSKHVDFIASEECLRIRTVNNLSEITWKPPSSAEMKDADEFWKEEVDLQIHHQRDIAMRLLSVLDFFKVSVVRKRRDMYLGSGNIEVSIDEVDQAGTFIEIEVKHTDPEKGKALIRNFARSLGLRNEQINRIPYRDLVPRLPNA